MRQGVEIFLVGNFDKTIRHIKKIPNTLHETILLDAWEEGVASGEMRGKEKWMEKGMELTFAIINMLKDGIPVEEISKKLEVKTSIVLKTMKFIEAGN